jgi:hypothetical protein
LHKTELWRSSQRKIPLAKKIEDRPQGTGAEVFVGMSEKTILCALPGWLRRADRPILRQESSKSRPGTRRNSNSLRARLGVALLPQQIQMLHMRESVFRPLEACLIAKSCARLAARQSIELSGALTFGS